MSECQVCGGIRLNGTPIKQTEDGWRPVRNPNPADPKVKLTCRSCAKEKINGR